MNIIFKATYKLTNLLILYTKLSEWIYLIVSDKDITYSLFIYFIIDIACVINAVNEIRLNSRRNKIDEFYLIIAYDICIIRDYIVPRPGFRL